jgi:hypothetical protein
MTQRVIGWKLDLRDRSALLQRFRPVYPDVDADHVTLRGHTRPDEPPPPPVSAAVVGRADDGSGLECLVVGIDGATERPDGSTYHVTWSLDAAAGRKPVQSNMVLREQGWEPLDAVIPIRLHPASWPYG